MIYTTLLHSIKSRLAIKLILAILLLICAVSIILTSVFISRQKKILNEELYKRAHSLAQNLAYNSSNYLNGTDNSIIQSLVSGVKKEPDIEKVFLTDIQGKVLVSSDSLNTGKTFAIPARIDSVSREKWFPADQPGLRRMIKPVEIDVLLVDTQNTLIASPRGEIPFSDIALKEITYYFPSFSPQSDAVTFSAAASAMVSTASIMSVSLQDHTMRLLVNGGTNAFWNWDGHFLVFSGTGKTSGLYVVNNATGAVKKIAEDETGIYTVPCFAPDDRYIIATLLTKKGHNRLFRIPIEGGTPVQITFHDGSHWWPEFSPDGKWILYWDGYFNKLYAYNTQTKKSRLVFPGLNEAQCGGSFSPDGSQICYIRGKLKGQEVFIADFPFSGRSNKSNDPYGRQITSTGRHKWFTTDWSPDGKWITFCEEGLDAHHDILVVPSQGGEPINLTGSLRSQPKNIGYSILDVSMENLNRSIENGNRIALLISLLFIGIGSFGAFLLVQSIVRPIKNLAGAAGAIARGDLDQKVPTNRSDEIGILSESFNRMTEQLKISREEIETGTRELEKKHHELEKAYKELATLDKAKDDFLSLVSHELRTPLSSLLVFSEMLLKGIVDSEETRAEIHKTMVEECKRLSRLISDVLDLSKIEAGRMHFLLQTVHIRELICDTLSRLNPIIAGKRIHVDTINVPEDIYLRGDRDKIIQVLENIVSNALKFTPEEGSISVSLTADKGEGIIAVRDTGKGIKKADIPKVFDRFSQLECIDRHSEGTGLGMTISKSIIERLGGRIWIESEVGRGTTVFFTLKREEHAEREHFKDQEGDSEPAVNEISSKNSPTCKILVVDDEKAIRLALTECLKTAGYEPLEASEGGEALRIARNHRPALIILDVMMPDISGLEVCRTLKKDPGTSGIKIIMLSARGQEKEKEEGLQAGADRYITKPFSYEELMREIEELIRGVKKLI